MIAGLVQPVLDFLGISFSDFLLLIIILLSLKRKGRN